MTSHAAASAEVVASERPMTDIQSFEQQLSARAARLDALFRAPAGLLARMRDVSGDRVRLVRLVQDTDISAVRARLRAWLQDEGERVAHPALLFPDAELLEPEGLEVAGLEYDASPATATLAHLLTGDDAGTLTPRRLIGQLVPVAEALDALHGARQVHGALGPVTVIVDRVHAGDDTPILRLIDAGLEAALRPILARDVLGLGPSPRRRSAPNYASDVRAFGHLLTWLQRRFAALEVTDWPGDLVELAARAARKRPIRISTVVSELKRIVATWGSLSPTGDPTPDASGPLKLDSGAARGSLVALAATEPDAGAFDTTSRQATRKLHVKPLAPREPEPHEDPFADLDDGWSLHSDELPVVDLADATTPEAEPDGEDSDDDVDADAAEESGDHDATEAPELEPEPEATEPEATEPEATEPEATVPEATEVEVPETDDTEGADDIDDIDDIDDRDVEPDADDGAAVDGDDEQAFDIDVAELESDAPESDAPESDAPPPAPSAPPSATTRRRSLPDLTSHGYELTSVLGFNAPGERVTYAGHARESGQDVVAKRLGTCSLAQLEPLLAALRGLDHPRVALLLDAFDDDEGSAWLVQRFVDRPSVASRSRWSHTDLKAFADSALELLEHFARQPTPLVHDDIKPENLLVDEDGRCILVDIGVANLSAPTADDDGPHDDDTTGASLSDDGFVAPERLEGAPPSAAGDLYGLGATLLSMAAGLPGYRIHEQIDDAGNFDLSCLPDGASDDLRAWFGQLLAPDPARRFQSPVAARAALGAIEFGHFDGEVPPVALDPRSTRPLSRDELHPAVPVYVERKLTPRGRVEHTSHTLLADVRYEAPAEQRRNGPLMAAVFLLVIFTLTGLIVWRILGAQEPSASQLDVPTGDPRVVVEYASAAPLTATATHAGAGLLATCNDRQISVYALDSTRIVARAWPGGDGCRALAFERDASGLVFGGRRGVLSSIPLGTTAARPVPLGIEVEGELIGLQLVGRDRVVLRERGADARVGWRVVDPGRAETRVALPDGAVACHGGGHGVFGYARGTDIELFATRNGAPLRTLEARGAILGCALADDGVRAAAVVDGFGIQHWRMATGTSPLWPALDWQGIDRARTPVQLRFGASSDQLLVATGSAVLVVSPGFAARDHAEHVQALSTERGETAVATDSSGSKIFLTARDGLLIHDLADGVTRHVDTSRYRLGASAFSADGTTLVTLHTPRRGLRGSASADEPRAASLLSRWNLVHGRLEWSIPLTFEPYAISLDPSASSVVAAERLGTHHELHVFAARDGSYTTRTGLPGRLDTLDWSPDGEVLLVGSDYAGARVLFHDAGTLSTAHSFPPDTHATLWRDNQLLLWDGDGLRGLALGSQRPSAALLSPDALDGMHVAGLATHPFTRTVVAYGAEGAFHIDLATRSAHRISEGSISDVAFSPDGERYVAGGVIHASRGGAPLLELAPTGQAPPRDVRWSGDRQWLTATTDAGEVLLSATSGQIVAVLDAAASSPAHTPSAPASSSTTTRTLGQPGELHPKLPLIASSRSGQAVLEDLGTVRPLVGFGLDEQSRWALTDGHHFVGSQSAPVSASDGYRALEAGYEDQLRSSEAISGRLAALGLRAEPRHDPLADDPPLAFPQLVTLRIDTTPSGALVRLAPRQGDEPPVELGRTPLDVELVSSDVAQRLELELDGYATDVSEIVLAGDLVIERELLDRRTATELDTLRIEGPLQPEAVARLVQQHRDRLRQCAPISSLSVLFGTGRPWAQLRLVVAADGAVREVTIADSNLDAVGVACLEQTVANWQFARQATGSVVEYRVELAP